MSISADETTHYRELAHSIADIFFALDRQTKFIYWNEATEALTGLAAADVMGKSVYDIFPEIKGTRAEDVYLNALETQQPHTFVQSYPLQKKSTFFEVRIYPYPVGVSILAKNVTYQKQMEEALKKSWDYLQNLNDSLGDAIFTVMLPAQQIEYVNRAVEHIFGYTAEECISKPTAAMFPDRKSYLNFARKLQQAIRQEQEILRTDHLLKRKDGSLFMAEITTTFLNETGELSGIISIVRDITDRKQMELALEHERASLAQKVEERTVELRRMNTELARASRLKDEFLANISHDLRTPLNAILGYAKILRKADQLNPLQIEGLETIRRSGEQLLRLITDILELAKMQSGHQELHPTNVHLPEFLQHIANITRIQAEQKGITFVYAGASDLPLGIRADQKRLHEILINLLDNAVKFTEQGYVRLDVTQQALTTSAHARLRFQITDSGSGIFPEQLEEIFLPFQRSNPQRHSIEGTGLGLAISRHFVRMMDSELQVQSRVGKGSVFWFELDVPILANGIPEIRREEPCVIGYHGPRKSVVIVDDTRANRELLRNIFAPLGFTVFEAEDGRQCLELTRRTHPDLVLLDLRMPGMDGFEVARSIRRNPEFDNIVVIAISANVLEETRQKSLDAGCQAFLAKPLEEEALFDSIHTHLHVEWIYRETNPPSAERPVSAEELRAFLLPKDELDLLREFAQYGNVTRMLQQLKRLEDMDDAFKPLITELRRLVKSFQIKPLLNLLNQLEGRHDG